VVAQRLRWFDTIISCVGQLSLARPAPCLRPGGGE
jgi:hypothetical protein